MAWLFRSPSQQKQGPITPQPKTQQSRTQNNASSRQNAFYDEQRGCLPPNFAQDLMELELESELPTVTIETIQKLLELYQVGVEYYSSMKSDKYLVFKNKSQQLLLRQNVNEVLNQPPVQTPAPVKKEAQVQRSYSALKQKEFDNNLKQVNPEEQVQSFLHSHRSEIEKIETLIQTDLTDQQKRLQDRIGKRLRDPSRNQFSLSKCNSLQVLETNTDEQTHCGTDRPHQQDQMMLSQPLSPQYQPKIMSKDSRYKTMTSQQFQRQQK